MRPRGLFQHAGIVTITLLAPTVAPAYPIPPAPLWRLVHDADAIVVAKVVSVDARERAVPPTDDDVDVIDVSGSATARLHVTERWKGEIDTDVEVPFEPNMVCPAPPRYEPGETVLAFLVRDDLDQAWQTVHLSYGTVYPPPEDVPVYAARVREALALQRKAGLERVDRIEWLVRCAEHRATRWNGLYELVGAPKPSAYEDGELRIPPAELLTDEHRARIVRGYLRDARLDDTLPLMLDVLGSYRDDRLDRAVVAAVDQELGSDEPEVFTLHAVIPAILSRLGDAKAEARIPDVGDDGPAKSHLDALRKAWTEAKAAVLAEKP